MSERQHAWSRDPVRDASVRAAEDGRAGPLPTLDECMEAPFTQAAERSSTVSKKGDGQSGMRTERITLEVTHDLDARLSDWIVEVVDESLGLMESVRVVDEPIGSVHDRAYADKMACDEERDFANRIIAERDAAIRERDAHKEEYYKLRASAITQALTADRFASAVAEADTLRARVAELEAKLAPNANADGELNHAKQAASGGRGGEGGGA